MVIKLKICGISTLTDIRSISELNVDILGIVGDKVSKRYASEDFLKIAKKNSKKPLAYVKVNGSISELLKESEPADYLQIHRVLTDKELEELKSFSNKKFILFVPSHYSYLQYLKKALDITNMVLLDSPKKGEQVNFEFLKSVTSEYEVGVAGGINIFNIDKFLNLNPKWIDISSGIEIFPGKKDLALVHKIIDKVKKNS
ncbi:N-(5'-phosphoribosyl)anthranilate isomerase [Acidianus sulfidivorans JP7]|uniref:N-(5'-phosphoribosyl)anthranilate isomerase n=1 Tax=Acidianus sulfidivorans JP7 TaxID=619593 RepID=A0A2U9IP26_9CREN|nr:N-(5'-phosphoribosyl)anthranilate isomerase [Acidianus sulfidivorans]AWR97763.1 N-(5'-phosphoribosyl)anthranilate isomerase [Acidianus sulfidivorans JP7]